MLQYDLVTAPGESLPRPLFVHSNLLKHLGGGLDRGGAFTHIKHMPLDRYDDASLDSVYFYVYQGKGRGMCTDMGLHNNALEKMGEAKAAVQKPTVVEVATFPEFEGFEESWWDAGGRVGGW